MAIFPIWIPIIITVLAFLWIAILGRFLPGPFDDIAVFALMIGTWMVWGFSMKVEEWFNNILLGNMTSILIGVVIIIAVVVYIKMKKYIIFVCMSLLLLLSAYSENIAIDNSNIKVEIFNAHTFLQTIASFLRNPTQQTIIAGTTGELIVGQQTSVISTFTPICTKNNKLTGYFRITTGGKEIFRQDITSKLVCNERRQVIVRFTPVTDGTYQMYYKIINLDHPNDDMKINTEEGITNNFETRTITAIAKTATYKPYCAEIVSQDIFNNGEKIGHKSEKRCFSAPGVFKENVQIECFNNFISNEKTNDYSSLTCIEKQEEEPIVSDPIVSDPIVSDSCGDGLCLGETEITCPSDCLITAPIPEPTPSPALIPTNTTLLYLGIALAIAILIVIVYKRT